MGLLMEGNTLKTCAICLEEKELDQFYIKKGVPSRGCIVCTVPYNTKNVHRSLDKKSTENFSNYAVKARAQDYRCAICDVHEKEAVSLKGPRLYYDHDHKTGKPRGLLCSSCNTNLGFYEKGVSKKEESWKEKADKYLSSY